MTDAPPNDSSPAKPKAGCGCLTIVMVAAFCFAVFLLILGAAGPVEIPFYIAFGWIGFITRTIPKISVNIDMILFAGLCLLIVLVIGHQFTLWLVSSITSKFKWTWKWTFVAVIGVCLPMLVGMSVVGLVHQIGWISSSTEPLYRVVGRGYMERFEMMNIIPNLQGHEFSNSDEVKEALRKTYVRSDRWSANFYGDKFHVLIISTPTNDFSGFLIFPRDVEVRKKVGGILIHGDDYEALDFAKIDDRLKTEETNLTAVH